MSSEASAPTREVILTLLLRQGESSAAKLASALGISVQAMRRHLRSLEEDGLVQASPIPIGPGRPSNVWELTSQGQNCFEDSSENFALDLLESIQETLSPETISALMSKQAFEKACLYRHKIGKGNIKERLKKLVELRRLEGYLGEFEPAPDGAGWYMNEFHCSIRRIAEEYPVVCDQELQMIRQTFPDCQIDRVQWRIEKGHACGFHIQPTSKDD